MYADETCDNACYGYDLSSNGLCELLPLAETKTPAYDGLSSCENANYTWSCTDYTTDNATGAPICTLDSGVITGNATSQSECLAQCNPNLLPTCSSDAAEGVSDTTVLGDGPLSTACAGLEPGFPCLFTQTSAETGGIEAVWEGSCTYCAKTNSMSDLYCGPPFTIQTDYGTLTVD